MKIAIAGNPNSGKTTMYNVLTGKNETVGNWAGVTVDKKESEIKRSFYDGEEEIIVVDLPGAYSLSPFTSEESVTRDYILKEKPDVLINLVDATNLSRGLFFTTQLLELGIPTVVALNKCDINEKRGTRIDLEVLAQKLSCPVVETVSSESEGIAELIKTAVNQMGKTPRAPFVQGAVNNGDKKAVLAADKKRFAFVNKVVSAVETRKIRTSDRNINDKIDAIITHPIMGIGIFAVVMFLVFQISQAWVGPWVADHLVAWLEIFQGMVGEFFADANPLLYALLIDGVIGGVIAVIGFLPLVMVMYFLIALLEDCGYMARVSVVLDPIFKKVGLSGKSVIPFVITIGCAVPGIMASRTIRDDRERRSTAMLSPFMPCGAKIPVIALFGGAFFTEYQGLISAVMYFTGILLIFLFALLVNKITGYNAKKSYFIIEMPDYKAPSLWRAFLSMCARGWAYVVKAATVILLCNTVVQVMQAFDWRFQIAASADSSILAAIARPFAYLLIPVVGYHAWQLAAAAITGFIAKENVVGTLAVCYVGLENLINMDEMVIAEGVAGSAVSAEMQGLTTVAALAYLMFNLYSPPCFAALAAMSSEMKSGKWFWGGVGLQLCVGFIVGFLVYQVGTLITTGNMGNGFVPGLLAIFMMIMVIMVIIRNNNEDAVQEKGTKNAA